jgi:hypothetical protein
MTPMNNEDRYLQEAADLREFASPVSSISDLPITKAECFNVDKAAAWLRKRDQERDESFRSEVRRVLEEQISLLRQFGHLFTGNVAVSCIGQCEALAKEFDIDLSQKGAEG